MLTTGAALQAVLAATPEFTVEVVAVSDSTGRILAQSVVAERDQPPFDRVMMDGIAFASTDYESGQREFPIQAMQAAGDPMLSLQAGHCIEIMTGAALPIGADCIVPVERTTATDGAATIEADYEVKARRFVHPRGSDFKVGAALLQAGKRISPMDIAIIESCGLTEVSVSRDPVIRVISTGNELVAAGQSIADHQIRMSNGPAVISLLGSHGYKRCSHDHIEDDVDTLRERLADHLSNSEVLILSGGVSMGKADYVPHVLKDLDVEVIFHKVSQRPGKPMWFGKGPAGQLVFALPGNPVSALVCCRQYVVPALLRAAGVKPAPPEFAVLVSNVSFKPDLTCFQPVKLTSNTSGQVIAVPVKTNTSGDFASLSATDGYVELPREQTHFDAGTTVFLHRWIAA
ncbi:MAG: molybdopterin molybdotransferase MoeA [Gammaproteobacteria bacterium]|nr:molybdopterin molybdotransferase MoeA [Gammaproteobacteria bacterium]